MVAMITFAGFKVSKYDVAVSIMIFVVFVLLGMIYYLIIKHKYKSLSNYRNVKKYGNLFKGLIVPKDKNRTLSMLFPLVFILRRTVFAINAIVMFDYPHM